MLRGETARKDSFYTVWRAKENEHLLPRIRRWSRRDREPGCQGYSFFFLDEKERTREKISRLEKKCRSNICLISVHLFDIRYSARRFVRMTPLGRRSFDRNPISIDDGKAAAALIPESRVDDVVVD